MHLLDTDTLVHLHAGHPNVVHRLSTLEDPHVGIKIITNIELLRGRFDFLLKADGYVQLLRAQQLLLRTDELLLQVKLYYFDELAGKRFDQLLTNRGVRKIGRPDLLIASIALAHNAVVVTRNLKDFQKVSGLRTANWVD